MRFASVAGTTVICLTVLLPISAQALPVAADLGVATPVEQVAGGCGPGRWRGPWGHCRSTPYVGPLPGGWYQVRGGGNGCPPGYWRGPWGHCRNTPYHGRLPGGGWKP
jgi:hypothetical protein